MPLKQLFIIFLLGTAATASAQSNPAPAAVSWGKVLLDTTLNGSADAQKTGREYYEVTERMIKKIRAAHNWPGCRCKENYKPLTGPDGAEEMAERNPYVIFERIKPLKIRLLFYDSGFMTMTLKEKDYRKSVNNYQLNRFGDPAHAHVPGPLSVFLHSPATDAQHDSLAAEVKKLDQKIKELPRTVIDTNATYKFIYADLYSSYYMAGQRNNGSFCGIYTGTGKDTIAGKLLSGISDRTVLLSAPDGTFAEGYGHKYIIITNYHNEHRAVADIDRDLVYYFEKTEK